MKAKINILEQIKLIFRVKIQSFDLDYIIHDKFKIDVESS